MTLDLLDKATVTQGDQQDYRTGWPWVFNLMSGEYPGIVPLPPALDVRWTYPIDRVLRSTFYHESMWASAIAKAISMQAALGFRCEDEDASALRIERSQRFFLTANGRQGWVHFLSQHLSDFLLTDNGAFVEIIRDERLKRVGGYWMRMSSSGAAVKGIRHLSSARCLRTGDPSYPVIYTDLKGRLIALRDIDVMCFSDMPRSDDAYFGVGRCAARRAYKTIYKLAAIENYISEKVSGTRALELHYVSGVSDKTTKSALDTAEAGRLGKGMVQYMGVVLAHVLGDQAVAGYRVPFAEVPDGFDAEKERDNAYIIYANAIGIAVQDLKPLSGQGLGTGAQSKILDQAAEGEGLASWRKQWVHAVNEYLLPERTTFHFDTNDTRDKKEKAELQKIQAETVIAIAGAGLITPQQGLQKLADDDVMPEEFLGQDGTAATGLTDQEKLAAPATGPASTAQQPALRQTPPSPLRQAVMRTIAQQQRGGMVTTKETPPDLRPIIDTASRRARTLTERMLEGDLDLDAWERGMLRVLAGQYNSAYVAGAGDREYDDDVVDQALERQQAYLAGFKQAIRDGAISPAQALARGQLYAESTRAMYWRGATHGMPPLPSVPGDGTTQCLTNCKCSLQIIALDEPESWDVYWRMSDAEHCQTCTERAAQWAPLQIREGVLL